MKMGQALSAFVEGKASLVPPPIRNQVWSSPFESALRTPSKAPRNLPDHQTLDPEIRPPHDIDSNLEPTDRSRPSLLTEESTPDSPDTIATSVHSTFSDESDPEESIDTTFARATYLIREALDVQGW